MLFRRIILAACCAGLIGGLLLTILQQVGTTPIILAAEEYELPEATALAESGAAGHDPAHGAPAWSPEDGVERTFYSFLSNSLAGIAFSAVLIALMSQVQIRGMAQLNALSGLAWGAAGFAAFFAAPAIGLPPEIPGIDAGPIAQRQVWWVLTALATAAGIGLIAFAPRLFKAAGAALIAAPHVLGAPRPAGPEFHHPDPDAVALLTALHHDFIIASAVTNLLFWTALGLASAWLLNRWVLKDLVPRP